jgi:hypothetical protein
LEAHDDGERWLWLVFDLAWQKVKGSPLQAARWVWHETEGEGIESYAWELDFARVWKRDSRPGTGPDEAKRIEKLSYLKAWAKRRPGFYYSSLDDLFSASVWAIDLLTLSAPDKGPPSRTSKAGPRRRGRKKLQAHEVAKRNRILEAWERAEAARVRRKDFCADNNITVDYLEQCQEWRRQRNKLHQ